ncbi:MAG: hypothetical protein JW942_10380 [Opitutales bacterium]|nr:hypothetical protein [Opitutales bacterium]
MKKSLLVLLMLAGLALPFTGCLDSSEEASGTVPWGAPSSWEGGGPGMPNMNQKD